MIKAYEKIKDISYYSTNNRLMLTKANLAMLFQDMAIDHSDSLGYTMELLLGMNRGWIITNWHIVFERTPLCGEKIKIKTWSEGCKRFMADRGFIAEDMEGNEIIKAESRWVFMDLKERKPCVIPKEMEDKYYSGIGAAIEGEKHRMPKVAKETADDIYDVTVERSQTDTNGHTNNTQYIAWAMDRVPDEIYDTMDGYDMRVVYRKESYRGSRLRLKTYVEAMGDEKMVNTFVVSADDENIVHAQVSTLWRNGK